MLAATLRQDSAATRYLLVAGQCVFVGDVKYKRLSARGYQHADLYQLLAYLTALGLPVGLLVYPTSEAATEVFQVPMAGKQLRIHILPVDGDPDDIDREVRRLVSTVLTMAHPPATGPSTLISVKAN